MCARAATAYGATLLGLRPEDAMVDVGALKLDFFAVAVTALLGLLLSAGTKESSSFNTGRPPASIPIAVLCRNVMSQCLVCCAVGALCGHASRCSVSVYCYEDSGLHVRACWSVHLAITQDS